LLFALGFIGSGSVGLASVAGAFILSQALPGRRACPGTVTAVSAHVRSAGTGRPPAARPGQPGRQDSAVADAPFGSGSGAAVCRLLAGGDACRAADDVAGFSPFGAVLNRFSVPGVPACIAGSIGRLQQLAGLTGGNAVEVAGHDAAWPRRVPSGARRDSDVQAPPSPCGRRARQESRSQHHPGNGQFFVPPPCRAGSCQLPSARPVTRSCPSGTLTAGSSRSAIQHRTSVRRDGAAGAGTIACSVSPPDYRVTAGYRPAWPPIPRWGRCQAGPGQCGACRARLTRTTSRPRPAVPSPEFPALDLLVAVADREDDGEVRTVTCVSAGVLEREPGAGG
jgi:hypothetical protein